jgi:hypothetical protein
MSYLQLYWREILSDFDNIVGHKHVEYSVIGVLPIRILSHGRKDHFHMMLWRGKPVWANCFGAIVRADCGYLLQIAD